MWCLLFNSSGVGPHVCVASTVTTEPSLQPWRYSLLLFNKVHFIFYVGVCMSLCQCVYTHMDPMKSDLSRGTYNHTWVLRTKLRSLQEQLALFTTEPPSTPILLCFGFSPNIQVHQKSSWLKIMDKKLLYTKQSFRRWKLTPTGSFWKGGIIDVASLFALHFWILTINSD